MSVCNIKFLLLFMTINMKLNSKFLARNETFSDEKSEGIKV